MTLSKCKACGSLISKKAKSCPQCGHPVKKTSILLKVFIVLIAMPFLALLTNDTSKTPPHDSPSYAKPEILYIGQAYPVNSPVENTYIRTQPSIDSPMDETGGLVKNQRIYVLEESGEWIRFRVTADDCGWSAWMPKKYTISLKELRSQREAKFGKSPHQSSWDGSVRIVENFIRSIAKDPQSIRFDSWSDVYYNDNDGWIIYCVYRGKNSFGAYTVSANWFVIQHDQVVDIKDGDAYAF